MTKNVLITGASGLVGTRLTAILLDRGYEVAHLGRTKRSKKDVKSYIWDINKGIVEKEALENANIVIHLAGAGVADQRWTPVRKQEILKSRTKSTALLRELFKKHTRTNVVFISASAIGIYGWDTGAAWLDETSDNGTGFLAEVTKAWEKEVKKIAELNCRVVMLRIGVVLSGLGGALSKMSQAVRWNAGAPLGSGNQYLSWIHIDDLCMMFVKAIENDQLSGVYNAVAPNPVTNKAFTQALANAMNKRMWLPAVPAWTLKIILGEMAQMVLGGNRVSSNKIASTGFNFKFAEVEAALKSIQIK